MWYFDELSPTFSLYIDAFCHLFNKVFMYVCPYTIQYNVATKYLTKTSFICTSVRYASNALSNSSILIASDDFCFCILSLSSFSCFRTPSKSWLKICLVTAAPLPSLNSDRPMSFGQTAQVSLSSYRKLYIWNRTMKTKTSTLNVFIRVFRSRTNKEWLSRLF